MIYKLFNRELNIRDQNTNKCKEIYKRIESKYRELNIRDQNTNKCKEIYKRIESKYEIMKSKLKSNYTYSQNFQLILI